jgi:anti-sigma factor RsiW
MNDPHMTGSELLVQRFVDQELSTEERLQLLVRLGHDETLRHRLIELEHLVLDVSRLSRPAVPDGFVTRVMEQAAPPATPARSAWRRLIDVLWTPRSMQWNLASAAAVASLPLLVVGGLIARGLSTPTPSTLPDGVALSAPSTPVLVRLVVVQPGARTVQAAGDFNGWNPERTPLEQVSSGAWTVTIPLEPGRYEYMFVIDGRQWIADPFAAEQNDDGFGSRNAVLEVRPLAGASL